MSRLPLLLAVAIAAACAPATQRAYVAPSPETIVSTTEQHEADPPSHTIYIENHSTVPVTVFSVYLTNCQNIHGECGPHPVKLRVPAAGRVMAMRIQPANPQQSYYYRFGFSWHEDSSSTAALAALAQSGDQGSRAKLAAMQRADSERRAETGPHFNELSRNDYTALAGKVTALRAYPESLVMVPGTRASVDQIRLLLVDARGQVLGRTRWVRWRAPGAGAVEFLPPDALVARRPGRSTIRFNLADEAQQALGTSLGELEYPLIAAYPPNPHAPVFEGLALDGDSRKPLACARVALEDSAQNVVVRDRTGPTGTFMLAAPRPGTYRVRVEAPGWAPVYGPSELAGLDEEKQHEYLVKFTEQMLSARFARDGEDIEHARPVAVSTGPVGAPASRKRGASASVPVVQGVTLGGSESMPILGIIGRAPAGTTWMQFVVDSLGVVDTASISLPPATDPRAAASVASVLPRVRFVPARENGKPVCELLRMQVNFTPR